MPPPHISLAYAVMASRALAQKHFPKLEGLEKASLVSQMAAGDVNSCWRAIRGSATASSCSGWLAPIVISIALSGAPGFVVGIRSPVDSSAGTFSGVCGLLALPTLY